MITQGFKYKGILGAEDNVDEILPGEDWTQYTYLMEFDLQGTGITYNKKMVVNSKFGFQQRPTVPAIHLFDQSDWFTVDTECIKYIGSKEGFPRLEHNYNEEYWGVLELSKEETNPGITFKSYPSSACTKLGPDYRLDIPKTFLFYTINATPELPIENLASINYKTYSFILEPVKLTLVPVSVKRIKNQENQNCWTVTTSACLKKARYYPFDTYKQSQLAYNIIDYEKEKDLTKNGLEAYDSIDLRPFVISNQFLSTDLEIEAKIPSDVYVRIPKTIGEDFYFVCYDLAFYNNCVKRSIISASEFNSNQNQEIHKTSSLLDEDFVGYNSASKWYTEESLYIKPRMDLGSLKISYQLDYDYVNWQTQLPERSHISSLYSPNINGKSIWEEGLKAHNNGFYETSLISSNITQESTYQYYRLLQFKPSTEYGLLGEDQYSVVKTFVNLEESTAYVYRTSATTEFLGVSCVPNSNGLELSFEYETYFYKNGYHDLEPSWICYYADMAAWSYPLEWDSYGVLANKYYFSCMWADPGILGLDTTKPKTGCSGFNLTDGYHIRNADYSPVYFNSDGSNTNNQGPVVLQWNLPKPPHTYSLKIKTINNDDRLLDTDSLRFYLKSSIIKKTAKNAWIEHYIATRHHHISYPLTDDWVCADDYISYSLIIDKGYILDDFAKNIKITVGRRPTEKSDVLDFDTEYDISTSPFLPAAEACCLKVTYTNPIIGRFRFGIKATLKTSAVYQETIDPIMIEFSSESREWVNPATPIFLETISETPVSIEVSGKHLSNTASWPNRDLRNSKIIWNTYDKEKNPYIYGSGPRLWSESNGSIVDIIPGESYLFDESTWTVKMSGYNSEDYISLYSERYDEESFVQTNSQLTVPGRDLSQYFTIEEIESELDAYTRTIKITPIYKSGDMKWDMLKDDTIYWDWSWDNKTNSSSIPVSAFNSDGEIYTQGTVCKVSLIKELTLKINVPVASLDYPSLHTLQIKVVSTTQYGRIEAYKTYELEEFPPDSYFNSRMMVSYYATAIFGEDPNDVENTYIADSSLSASRKLQITRKNQGNNLMNQFLVHVDLEYLRSNSVDTYSVAVKRNGVIGSWVPCEVHNNYNIERFDDINFNAGMVDDTTSMEFIQRIEIQPPNWKQSYYKDFTINFDVVAEFFDGAPFKPIEFITYPYFSWFPWTDQIFVLNNTEWDENYYSNWSYSPTALYSHDDTVGFYFALSANTSFFDTYTYTLVASDEEQTPLFTVQTPAHCPFNNNLIHIPSLPEITSEMYKAEGIKVKLRASRKEFPPDMPLEYKVLTVNNTLETLYFPLTAESIDANASNVENSFKKSLRLHEYEDALHYRFVFFTHDPIVNMSYQNNIRVWQSLGMLEQTPMSILDIKPETDGTLYTVTYLVSCTNWTDTVTIPYSKLENPDHTIYTLTIGDGAKVGCIDINDIYTPFVVRPLSYDIRIGLSDKVLSSLHEHWQNYRGIYNPLPPYLLHKELVNWVPDNNGFYPEYQEHYVMVKNTWFDSSVYVSTYHSLTGSLIDFEINVPPKTQTTYNVILNYGDGTIEYATLPDEQTGYVLKRSHQYDVDGTYYVSYSAIDNIDENLFKSIKTLQEPLNIYKKYDINDYKALRIYGEEKLSMPHSLNEVLIKPNEFVDHTVINTSIKNILNNLEYLKNNTVITPNTTPTNHFGWLGYNQDSTKTGLRWWSVSDFNDYYYKPYLATSIKNTPFEDLRDVIETPNHLIVLGGNGLSFYKKGQYPELLNLLNKDEISANLVNPVCMGLWNNQILYILDSLLNKITSYKILFNNNSVYLEQINTLGGYGAREELTKLDTPTELLIVKDKVYVLDYANKCIKSYNLELIWQKTFYIEEFELDSPSNFSVYENTGEIYVLTQRGNIYIFNQNAQLSKMHKGSAENIKFEKLFFDLPGNYMYIVTQNAILKFDVLTYSYISRYSLNEFKYSGNKDLKFVSARSSLNCSILLITKNCVIKSHDFMKLDYLTNHIPTKYWPYEDIKINPNELIDSQSYNRIFLALCQNIKSFRDNINAKLNLIKEKTDAGIIHYYSVSTITEAEKCILNEYVESENLYVNDQEFNITQVVNRPLVELYNALELLQEYLQISDLNIDLYKCDGLFCWSWKQLSCFGETSLPAIQQCGFNPITYEELKNKNNLEDYVYAPTNVWENTTSECCESNKYLSPLNYVI